MDWQDVLKIISVFLTLAGTAYGAARFVTREREKQNKLVKEISDLKQRLEVVSTSLREGVNRYQSLTDISTSAQTAIGADFHSISIPVPHKNPTHFKIIASTDPEAEKVLGKEFPIDRGLAGRVFKTQIPEYVNRANQDPNHYKIVDQAAGTRTGEGGILSYPLVKDDICYGVVQYMKRQNVSMFSEEDITIVSRFVESIVTEIKTLGEKVKDDALLGAVPKVFRSILFSDINKFGYIAKKIRLHQTVGLIDEYYRRMLDVALPCGCAFEEYLGDGLYLSFQGRTKQETILGAIRCAQEMQEAYDSLRKEWSVYQYPVLDENYQNIGIASGELFEGTVGHPQHRKRKLIGQAVDVAAHLVEVGKGFGPRILADKLSYEIALQVDIRFDIISSPKNEIYYLVQ